MTAPSTTGLATRKFAETDLDSIVPITTDGTNLCHHAGPSLYDSDGHNDPVSVIDLSHADFSPNESNRHNSYPHGKRNE
jgi:hypothetical protein